MGQCCFDSHRSLFPCSKSAPSSLPADAPTTSWPRAESRWPRKALPSVLAPWAPATRPRPPPSSATPRRPGGPCRPRSTGEQSSGWGTSTDPPESGVSGPHPCGFLVGIEQLRSWTEVGKASEFVESPQHCQGHHRAVSPSATSTCVLSAYSDADFTTHLPGCLPTPHHPYPAGHTVANLSQLLLPIWLVSTLCPLPP